MSATQSQIHGERTEEHSPNQLPQNLSLLKPANRCLFRAPSEFPKEAASLTIEFRGEVRRRFDRSPQAQWETFVNWIIGSLEYVFYIGATALVVGVLLWVIQFL